MTSQDITKYRLASQQISVNDSMTPMDVVSRLGAMQAQDYPGALWSIGLRLTDSKQESVEAAIKSRKIIRTWPMRGTLHFVAAADVRWMLELLTPRVITNAAYRVRNLELNDEIFRRSKDIFIKALQGDKQLSRSYMCQLLEEANISTKGQRGIHILWHLSQQGLLCFGPHEGKQPTFALLSEWAPGAKSLPRYEALANLAQRYFTGHGPATIQDFMCWSGLTAVDAKAGLEMAKQALVTETVDDKVYWMSKARPSLPENQPSVYLLPGFDEYLLGYRDRSAALEAQHGQKVVPGNNGMFLPTIVVDGRVVGLWKRTMKTKHVAITPKPFSKLSSSQVASVSTAAKRYGEFVGLTAQVVS